MKRDVCPSLIYVLKRAQVPVRDYLWVATVLTTSYDQP